MATQNTARNTNGIASRPGLRPWRPGESGNPGGRPKDHGLNAMIREKTEDGTTLVRFLVDVVEGREPRARVADRIEAARVLMDRAWGKPVQSMELSGLVGGPIETQNLYASLDLATLRKLVELRDQMLALAPAAEADAAADGSSAASRT